MITINSTGFSLAFLEIKKRRKALYTFTVVLCGSSGITDNKRGNDTQKQGN